MAKQSISQKKKICKVETCFNPHKTKGYCQKHYMQVWYYGKILKRTIHDPNEIIIKGNIAEIFLYNAKHREIARAIINVEDVEKIKKHKWHLHGKNNTNYVATNINKKTVYLSNIIMGREAGDSFEVDHKDHDLMNNKKSNLRKCTHGQNMFNRELNTNSTSGYKGVWWDKDKHKWVAQIERKVEGKRKNKIIGRFANKIEAAKAYNKAALQCFGEFAYLNEV